MRLPLSLRGMKALIPALLGMQSVAMVAQSLWSVQVPKILSSLAVPLSLFQAPDVGGL